MTRAHPRVRGGLPARLVSLVGGLFLFAVAIVLLLESRLGLSPWDVLNQGIAKHSLRVTRVRIGGLPKTNPLAPLQQAGT